MPSQVSPWIAHVWVIMLSNSSGIDAYRSGAWWANDENNWNLVCNGGLAAGALAFADVNSTFSSNASTVIYYVNKVRQARYWEEARELRLNSRECLVCNPTLLTPC